MWAYLLVYLRRGVNVVQRFQIEIANGTSCCSDNFATSSTIKTT